MITESPSAPNRATTPVKLTSLQIARLRELSGQLRSIQHDLGGLSVSGFYKLYDPVRAQRIPTSEDCLNQWEIAVDYFVTVLRHEFFPHHFPSPAPQGVVLNIRSEKRPFCIQAEPTFQNSGPDIIFYANEINIMLEAADLLHQVLLSDRKELAEFDRIWREHGGPTGREAFFAFLVQHPRPRQLSFTFELLDPFKALHFAGTAVLSGSLSIPPARQESTAQFTFSPAHVLTALSGVNKEEVLREMVARAAKLGAIRAEHEEETLMRLLTREERQSTGLGFGLATPHIYTDNVTEATFLVGLSPQGINFDAFDHQPVHYVVLCLIPFGTSQKYLIPLGDLAKATHKLVREQRIPLTEATPEQVYKIICQFVGSAIAGYKNRVRFNARHILPNLKATTRREVLSEIVGYMVQIGVLPASQEGAVLAGLNDREASNSTSIGFGMARPHTRLEGLDELVIAIGISPTGLDFWARDGKSITLVALFLYPLPTFLCYWGIDQTFVGKVLPIFMANPPDQYMTQEDYWALVQPAFQQWLLENDVELVPDPGQPSNPIAHENGGLP